MNLDIYCFTGFLNLYPGGGYIANLARTIPLSEKILRYLSVERWIDERTRAVVVQFILFNVNRNYFVQVLLLWEWSASTFTVTDYSVSICFFILLLRTF